MNNADASWREYGEIESYFGVISDPRFERRNLTEAGLEEFFRSGYDHVQVIFKALQKSLGQDFKPVRALDYGCGVGRVLIPLAERSGHVTGVDISEGMLEEARKNCRIRNLSNVALVPADDGLSRVSGKFDLIHSFIVLQHVPVVRGTAIIAALIGRLSVGGVAALHVPYLRDVKPLKGFVDWARCRVTGIHMLANLAKGHPLRRPLMQMNPYNLNDLFSIFHKNNCQVIFADFLNHGGNYGVFLYIQKTDEREGTCKREG